MLFNDHSKNKNITNCYDYVALMTSYMYCHDLSFMIIMKSVSGFPLFWTTVCLSISKEDEGGPN